MTERNYYVLCDDNCRFESMTKEQIYAAIAEATGMTPTPVDEAFITMLKEQNANHNLKMWKGTEAQYNALEETDSDTLYIVGTNKVVNLEDELAQVASELSAFEDSMSGAETRTLLWENASPSSGFAEQDITLPVGSHTDYDYFEILFRVLNTTAYVQTVSRFEATNGGQARAIYYRDSNSTWCMVMRQLWWTTKDTGKFHIAQCREWGLGNSTYSGTVTANLIPLAVYGIKEV